MFKKLIVFFLLGISGQLLANKPQNKQLIEYAGHKYYIHQVKKQETIFGISKTYDVSIKSILALNGKKTTTLQEGELLRIPAQKDKHALQKEQKTIEPRYDDNYYYHIVKPGETLASIARNYNMRFRKIVRLNNLNPDNLKPYSEVKIPILKARTEVAMLRIKERNKQTIQQISEKRKKAQQEISNINTTVADETDVYLGRIKDSYNLLLLLPLKNSWKGMKSYYKGMLTAVNEINDNELLNINLQVQDTKNSQFNTEIILDRFATNSDFIIGPYSKKLFPTALPYASKNTTVVSLLSKNNAVNNQKNILQASATEKTINRAIASYVVNSYGYENILISGNGGLSSFQTLDTLQSEDNIDLLSFRINSAKDSFSYEITEESIEQLKGTLDLGRKNIIIIPENKIKTVGKLLSLLDTFRDYDIEVIGYYKWKFFTTLEPDLFYRLNVTYFTPFHFDVENEKTFVENYANTHNCYPDDFSFMGYQIMKNLLSGIKTKGTHFYKRDSSYQKRLLGGFENTKLYRVTLKKDYSVSVAPFNAE